MKKAKPVVQSFDAEPGHEGYVWKAKDSKTLGCTSRYRGRMFEGVLLTWYRSWEA